jgi:thiosulfate/3-mercaptopyruvate sulfurtransferase
MRALISAEELRSTIGSVVLVDVQWHLDRSPGRPDYQRAHLPGAHFVDLDAELAGPPGPEGRHPMPALHAVQQALRRAGAHAQSRVVVYDQGPSTAAARAWWMFRYAGLAQVRVLDGGLAAWQAIGGPVTTEVPEPGAGTFEARAGGMPLLDAEAAAEVARIGTLLDARSAERFSGEHEPIDRVAGHIPGAVSAPADGLIRPDGRMRPPAELRHLFAELGATRGGPVGAYCGSGVTAAHTVLALHECGIEAPLYVGSWSHWIADPRRPVASGGGVREYP